jgi:NADPH:quinone reductase-like Zn-dependent oxidoreductase
VQDRYGTSEVLRLENVDRPEPAAGKVLVKVATVSINAADWHIMRGKPRVARLMDAASSAALSRASESAAATSPAP